MVEIMNFMNDDYGDENNASAFVKLTMMMSQSI